MSRGRSGMDMSAIIGLVVLAGVIVFIIKIFNRLVSLKGRYTNAFSQIEVQLKRRYDLIPNLVETAKGYLKHEQQTLENVIKARNEAMTCLKAASENPANAEVFGKFAQQEGLLSGALSKLNVVVEAYPDLKANENMMQLTEELTTTENKISFARQAYNDSVTQYNIYRQSFPQNILSPFFGHNLDAELLEFENKEQLKDVPKISF